MKTSNTKRAPDTACIAVFRRNLGKYSETFVRHNLKSISHGNTVAVCFHIAKGFDWIPPSRVLVLSKYPRPIWKYILRIFFWKHKVKGAVIEFLDWACEISPYLSEIGLPYVALGHGYDIGKNLHSVKNYKETLLKLNNAKKILLPSVFLKEILLSNTSLNPNLLIALPIGVDVERFSPAPNPDVSNTFTFIGRFTEKKAPALLILAFYEALKLGSNSKLRLGGDGELLSFTKQLTRGLKIQDRVEFIGVIRSEQVIEEIKKSRAVLLHSVTSESGDIEGMPILIQEAIALGTPVISTKHSGIPEVIIDGFNGYLVDEFDYKAMGERIHKIGSLPPNEYNQLRQNCRSHALQCFDQKTRIQLIEKLLDFRIKIEDDPLSQAPVNEPTQKTYSTSPANKTIAQSTRTATTPTPVRITQDMRPRANLAEAAHEGVLSTHKTIGNWCSANLFELTESPSGLSEDNYTLIGKLSSKEGITVKAIYISRTKRFSNSLMQLINAITLCQKHSIHYLICKGIWYLPPQVDLPNGISILNLAKTDSIEDTKYDHLKPTLSGLFFRNAPLAPLYPEVVQYTPALETLKDYVLIRSEDPPFPENEIVIHLRAGDVFRNDGANPHYGQPPLAFYKIVLKSRKWHKVHLVFEDEENPVIPAIKKFCDQMKLEAVTSSGTIQADIKYLTRAQTIIVGRGTFMPGVIAISKNAKTIYCFNNLYWHWGSNVKIYHVTDLQKEYTDKILTNNWLNLPWQRELMISYPIENLSPNPEPWDGHSRRRKVNIYGGVRVRPCENKTDITT